MSRKSYCDECIVLPLSKPVRPAFLTLDVFVRERGFQLYSPFDRVMYVNT